MQTGLETLVLADNELSEIPPEIGRLKRLRMLGRLSSLRELHLRNNRLACLPDSIGSLSELRQIDLRGNPLTNLPAVLTVLPRLEKLDLRWVRGLSPLSWFADLEKRGCAVYY